MKHLNSFTSFLLLLIVLLCNCSKDDNNEETNLLIGSWQSEVFLEDLISVSVIFTFNEDYTGTSQISYEFEGETWNESANFEYEMDDENLTLSYMDGSWTEVLAYSISGNTLTVTIEDQSVEFTKI